MVNVMTKSFKGRSRIMHRAAIRSALQSRTRLSEKCNTPPTADHLVKERVLTQCYNIIFSEPMNRTTSKRSEVHPFSLGKTMTATSDPLDVHIPKGRAPHDDIPGSQSSSSRSFFQALNSIDLSDRQHPESANHIHHHTSHSQVRRHRSVGHIDTFASPDSAAYATLFQRIMSDGIDDKDSGRPTKGSSFHMTLSANIKQGHLPKKGSSFHAPSSTKVKAPSDHKRVFSFHTNSSSSITIDINQLLSETPADAIKSKVGSAHITANSLPRSKGKHKSHRPVERRPIEKVPIQDIPDKTTAIPEYTIDKSPASPTMQVIDLLWHDLRGIKGTYSGQINSHIQPHGFGSLVLVDGTTITCKWYNGTPLERRRSHTSVRPKEQRSTLRRCSDGQVTHNKDVALDESTRTSGSDAEYKKSISEPMKKLKEGRTHSYQLGDAPKCSTDMVIPSSVERAIEYADSLSIHDFAFVLRSNGSWCYAIVAKKNPPSERKGIDGTTMMNYDDANILFVTDTKGSTKYIKMKHWGEMIRLVSK